MNVPPVIPDHALLRPIGHGAYGEVWLARNIMGALRAVKVVWRSQFDSDRPYEREFAGVQRYEPVSRTTGGLVHLLHVGRDDAAGYFYYVMELADDAAVPVSKDGAHHPTSAGIAGGAATNAASDELDSYKPRTFRSALERLGRLPTPECLRVALEVVSGLVQLHRQGLVHRDVKPGNIIFVDGRAKLADIGLITSHGEGRTFVGTPDYIAPEGPGSAQADIYALGIALYEASTGLPPERFPDVPPEWLVNSDGDEALEFHEIVLKACEGLREHRYQTAEEMQADLALLQSGQSVRKLRVLERRAALVRRFAWAAGVAVVIAVGVASFAQSRAGAEAENRAKERELREQAQRSQFRAESAERLARQQLNSALFEQARALVVSRELGHRTRALDAIRQMAGATNTADLRQVAFAALAQPDLQLHHSIPGIPRADSFAADAKFERFVVCRADQNATLHSTTDGRLLATLPIREYQSSSEAKWSDDGKFMALRQWRGPSGSESEVDFWEMGTVPRVVCGTNKIAFASCSFFPGRPEVLKGQVGGQLTLENLENGVEKEWIKLSATPQALEYSPNGELLAVSHVIGSTPVIACYETSSGRLVSKIECPELVRRIVWHPNGRWLTVTGPDDSEWQRSVRLFDVRNGTVNILGRHKLKTTDMAFAGDGAYLVSGSWDREMIWWDLKTRQRAFTFAGPAFAHQWKADGSRCFVSHPDDTLRVYDFETPLYRELEPAPNDGLRDGIISPDGRWLAAQDIHELCLWDLHTACPPAIQAKERDYIATFFSRDSAELFAAQPRKFDRWRTGAALNSDHSPVLEPLPVWMPKDMRRAALSSNELVFTSARGLHRLPLTHMESASNGVEQFENAREGMGYLSPDGHWLASFNDFSRRVWLYELPAMKQVAELPATNYISTLVFSPESDVLIVIHRSGLDWWDTRTWQRTRQQQIPLVAGSFDLFTPDGTGLWMVTHFRNTGLYDRKTLERILPLPADVAPVALSPDGRKLVVSVETRRVQLWDLPTLRSHFRELGVDW